VGISPHPNAFGPDLACPALALSLKADNAKIRVLLIEDNRFLREGITDILRKQGKFAVDARDDGDDSVGQLAELSPPDVILLDLGLEHQHALKLMEALRERFPQARVIAMDILPDQTDIVEFVKAGGAGFILKNAPLEDYLSTIRAVAGGATILPAMLTKSLFTQIVESVLKSGNTIPEHATRLTKREMEIVDLISEGMSNKEIAQQLHIATFTVKSHVHNVLEKLELNTRLQIAAFVRDGREK
jgi:DNA-binding NarL/FixJ family response regulator